MKALSRGVTGWVAGAGFSLSTMILALPAPGAAVPDPAPGAAAPAALAVGSPEWIVDRFFVQKEFPELARYATGEFAELYKDSPTLGSINPPTVSVATRVIERDAEHACIGVSITDGNLTKEWYAYLRSERSESGAFKLEAIRTMTLSAKFFEVLVGAERAAVGGKLSETGLIELDRFHRIIAADAEIKRQFLAQQPLFEAVERDFVALSAADAVSLDAQVAPAGSATPDQVLAIAQQLRALRLGAILRKFRDCEGCVVLKIGGDGENQVGYLHAGPGARVPKMSPRSFIYVEPIAPGWYIFKTV